MKKRPTPTNGEPSAQTSRKDTRQEIQADLFGGAAEAPRSLPNPGTQPRKALEYFAAGDRSTCPEWEIKTGSWRLSAHVWQLHHLHGWGFNNREIPAPTIACPGRTITSYGLSRKDIPIARKMLKGGRK